MAAKDFSFTGGVSKSIEDRQAILAIDNEDDTEILVKILKPVGIRIIHKGTDGKQAIEMVRKHKTGLFFLDFDIEGLGSSEIYNKIKLNYPGMKIIVLARQLNKDQVTEANDSGVAGFLVKPLAIDAIKKILKKL